LCRQKGSQKARSHNPAPALCLMTSASRERHAWRASLGLMLFFFMVLI
jgi:hypothetical protein